MTEAEYLARLAMRCTDWRERYPSRADELRSHVRRQLAIPLGTTSPFALQSLEQGENEVIRITQGWPAMHTIVDEPAPPVPSSGEKPPTQERFSGRDAAAGVERE